MGVPPCVRQNVLADKPGANVVHLDESRESRTCLGERPLADAWNDRLVDQLGHPDRQSLSKLDVVLGRLETRRQHMPRE
eukprot:3048465-Pyramimonas_sp.AAC.1